MGLKWPSPVCASALRLRGTWWWEWARRKGVWGIEMEHRAVPLEMNGVEGQEGVVERFMVRTARGNGAKQVGG